MSWTVCHMMFWICIPKGKPIAIDYIYRMLHACQSEGPDELKAFQHHRMNPSWRPRSPAFYSQGCKIASRNPAPGTRHFTALYVLYGVGGEDGLLPTWFLKDPQCFTAGEEGSARTHPPKKKEMVGFCRRREDSYCWHFAMILQVYLNTFAGQQGSTQLPGE